MEIVSFEVAKAIKEAGYPQDRSSNCYNVYTGEFHYTSCSDNWLKIGDYIDAPFVMDVWLWLWREKHCYIQIDLCFRQNNESAFISIDKINNVALVESSSQDPEETIKQAIEYLVTNNLIK